MTKCWRYMVTAATLLFATPAFAAFIGNGPFEKMVDSAKIVIKVRVLELQSDKAFKAEVLDSLKSDEVIKPNEIEITYEADVFPREFGTLTKGQTLLLFLGTYADGKARVQDHYRAILPASVESIRYGEHASVARKCYLELSAAASKTEQQAQKAMLLATACHLAGPEDAEMFTPFLKSPAANVRRAALAALLRVKPSQELVQSAANEFMKQIDDFKKRVDKLRPGEDEILFWKMYDDVRNAPRWDSPRAKTYLPLYRLLLDAAPADYQEIYIGIEGLRNVGTMEDVDRLCKALDLKKAWMRHDALEGLSRILGLDIKRPPIPGYPESGPLPNNIVEWEATATVQVKQAIEMTKKQK